MQLEIHQLDLKYAALRVTEPARQSRLVASLSAHGQHTPVVVVGSAESRYVLIDGYARVAALTTLAEDCVEAMLLELSETDALLWSHGLSAARSPSMLEEAWLLRELIEGHGKSMEELATVLGRSVSWVSRRLALVRVLPDSVQLAVKEAVISPQAAMKYLVPLARANGEQCERLVAGLGAAGASVREMHRLYVGWCDGDEAARQRIASHPRLYLKVEDEMSRPPATNIPAAGETLSHDLEALAGICRRVRRQLRAGALARSSHAEREAAINAWRQSELAFALLTRLMEEEIGDAGSGHADSHPRTSSRGPRDAHDRPQLAGFTQRGAGGDTQSECRELSARA